MQPPIQSSVHRTLSSCVLNTPNDRDSTSFPLANFFHYLTTLSVDIFVLKTNNFTYCNWCLLLLIYCYVPPRRVCLCLSSPNPLVTLLKSETRSHFSFLLKTVKSHLSQPLLILCVPFLWPSWWPHSGLACLAPIC